MGRRKLSSYVDRKALAKQTGFCWGSRKDPQETKLVEMEEGYGRCKKCRRTFALNVKGKIRKHRGDSTPPVDLGTAIAPPVETEEDEGVGTIFVSPVGTFQLVTGPHSKTFKKGDLARVAQDPFLGQIGKVVETWENTPPSPTWGHKRVRVNTPRGGIIEFGAEELQKVKKVTK